MSLAWLASQNDKDSEISLYALISNATGLHVQRIQSWIVNKRFTVSGDEHLEHLVSRQYLYCKRHLFVQKSWGITTSSKQTRSFYVRIEIKTLVILRMYLHTCRLSNYDTWMLSNHYIDFCYSEQFIANFIPCFLQLSFGLLCKALLVLKT